MKILFNLLIFKLLLAILVTVAWYGIKAGYLNTPIKHAFEYYLGLKDLKTKIDNLKIKDNQIIIDSVDIYKNGTLFSLKDIVINNHLNIDYSHSNIIAEFSVNHFSITQDNQEFMNAKLELVYNSYIIKDKLAMDLVLSEVFYRYTDQDLHMVELQDGRARIHYNAHKLNVVYDLQVSFDGDKTADIKIKDDDNFTLSSTLSKIPITLYKPFYYLYPKNKLLIFLNDFIKDGIIESSDIKVNLSQQDLKDGNYNQDNISGQTKITDLKLLYNSDLPALTKMQVDVTQKGLLTEFMVNQAYSTDLLIQDCLISMDWKGLDDTVLIINGKGSGPVSSLTDFISDNIHKNLQKSSIDLTKFTGNSIIDIKILIPLKPGTTNDYNITAHIPSTNLSIFNNKIFMQNIEIFGKYDGNSLNLDGKGKINNFNSVLSFQQNFIAQDETGTQIDSDNQFDHKLNIVTDIKLSDSKPQKLGFITVQSGNAKAEFEYININNEGKISLNSDLRNLEFYLDKISIHKLPGEEANMVLNGILDGPSSGKLDFKLAGSGNLNISGKALISENETEVFIDNLNHFETKLSGKIVFTKDSSDISIKGTLLDLSNANMLQFLAKEKDESATKMVLNVDKIKLKEGVLVDGLNLKLTCNKDKCHSGRVVGKVNSAPLDVVITEEGSWEKWLVTSGDAGALLKGIGAYNKMKGGNMSLVIKTSRKEIRAGEIIPILSGTFGFERFGLKKTSTLTKLISFVSLPGFFGIISGNNTITFGHMNGNFSFQEGVLKVKNCKAVGPFFSFTMQGDINTIKQTVNLRGYVTPALYGLTAAISVIPVIGRLLTGDDHKAGLVSAPYQVKDSYY